MSHRRVSECVRIQSIEKTTPSVHYADLMMLC